MRELLAPSPPSGWRLFFQSRGRAICPAPVWECGWGIGLRKTDLGLFGSGWGEGARELLWDEYVCSAEVKAQKRHTLIHTGGEKATFRCINFDRTEAGSPPYLPVLPSHSHSLGLRRHTHPPTYHHHCLFQAEILGKRSQAPQQPWLWALLRVTSTCPSNHPPPFSGPCFSLPCAGSEQAGEDSDDEEGSEEEEGIGEDSEDSDMEEVLQVQNAWANRGKRGKTG